MWLVMVVLFCVDLLYVVCMIEKFLFFFVVGGFLCI